MKARILDKSEEELWEDFIKRHPNATIHQTPKWGHFQAHVKGPYWIVVLEEKGEIIAGTLLIRQSLPRNYCWLYAARGPLADPEQIQQLLPLIKQIAKEEKAIFLRIDPPVTKPQKYRGFKRNREGFQPEHTLMIDLTLSNEKILGQMKQKGRYNIRVAQKKGVKIHKLNPKKIKEFTKDLNNFQKILKETTERDNFRSHEQEFYRTMLEILYPDAVLYLAKYENQTIAGIIVTYFKDTATYYYGASGNSHRNVMAPYLLQWKAIKDAKERGCKYYDFFGIAPPGAVSHPWLGVTQFKRKFGGRHIAYQKPQEYPFEKFLYFLYCLYKKLKQ